MEVHCYKISRNCYTTRLQTFSVRKLLSIPQVHFPAVKLNTHLNLLPTLRMNKDLPPVPVYTFLVCSFRHMCNQDECVKINKYKYMYISKIYNSFPMFDISVVIMHHIFRTLIQSYVCDFKLPSRCR